MTRGRWFSVLATATVVALSSPAVQAQIKPITSGEPSFNEPEMRKHGSGLTRPRRPHYVYRHHHRHHRYGYRFRRSYGFR